MYMTIGAPKTAVTELMLRSDGARVVLATRSQPRQNTEPSIKHIGVTISGFAVFTSDFAR